MPLMLEPNLTGGPGIRSMIIGFGSGCGVGVTYAEAKREFEELAPPPQAKSPASDSS